MALQEVTVSSKEDLLTQLQTFATVTLGWQIAAAGVFKANAADAYEFTITPGVDENVDNNALWDWDRFHLSITGSTKLSHEGQLNLITEYRRVWFKGQLSPSPWIMVIIEVAPNMFSSMAFGYLEPYVNGEVIPFVCGQGRDYNISNLSWDAIYNGDSENRGGILQDYTQGNYMLRPGSLYHNGKFYSFGGIINATADDPDAYAGGGIPGLISCIQTMMLSTNVVNNSVNLFKPRIWIQELGQSAKTFVGTLPIYACALNNLSGGQIASVAGDDYMFFPIGRKGGRESETGVNEWEYLSGDFGYAIKDD